LPRTTTKNYVFDIEDPFDVDHNPGDRPGTDHFKFEKNKTTIFDHF
jgi:hypothetical protein